MNCPKRERCPDEDTLKCSTCNINTKPVPVKAGIPEAIEYFKADIKAFDNILGVNAEQSLEYQVTQLAINALEEKRLREVK